MSNTTTEKIKNLEQKLEENKNLIKELKEENKNIQQKIFKEQSKECCGHHNLQTVESPWCCYCNAYCPKCY